MKVTLEKPIGEVDLWVKDELEKGFDIKARRESTKSGAKDREVRR